MKPQITRAKPSFLSHSPETGSDYSIYVDVPASPGPHPVALFMDGDFLFDPAVEAARRLSRAGIITPCLVVCVGYGASFGKPGNHRGRDYTPTSAPEEPSSGGADRFLGYLSRTLWPEIARNYPVLENGRLIGGHSLGSLLVLHALFQEKPFFDAALASAPSIWWDNRSILGLISGLRSRKSSLPGRLYLSVGEDDTPSMTGDLSILEKQLSEHPFQELRITTERFAGHDHYNVVHLALEAGLANLLGKP